MSYEFPSTLNLGDKVLFTPMYRDIQSFGLSEDFLGEGEIVAVRFTKQKVFYDCISYYYGALFRDIDSCKVGPVKSLSVLSED